MSMDIEEFFHDFRQDLLSGAEAREDFLEAEFAISATKELEESGAIEGFEPCHYKAPRGMRVDGYWFNDDGISMSSRPVSLNEVCSIAMLILLKRLAASGYYVISNDFAVHHQLSPSPSQNRACAINAHGSSLEPFHRVRTD